jgi:hypothetical protein
MIDAFQPFGVPKVRSSIPLVAFRPVGRSSLGISGSIRSRKLVEWKAAAFNWHFEAFRKFCAVCLRTGEVNGRSIDIKVAAAR